MAMTCEPTSLLRRLSSTNSISTKLRPRPGHCPTKDTDSKPLRPTSNSNSSASEQSPAMIKGSPLLSAVRQKYPGHGYKGSVAFELTPISALIQQAYTDIATLRNLDEKFYSAASSPGSIPGTPTPKSKSLKGLSESGSTFSLMGLFGKKDKSMESSGDKTPGNGNNGEKFGVGVGLGLGISGASACGGRGVDEFEDGGEKKNDIDFDAILKNLERFEELYKTWVRSGNLNGEAVPGEVHLVAMVCKEGDVIRGVIDNGVKGAKLPKVKKSFCDCGF
ncbi:hypothetical protein BGZ60DRAFT_89398 [Tricladium varicosporioides]|nr:hypothetical protein BGZ60DRAFT_89398 [Hymenoscyphus varicosporioides]